jgi:hypothetical protein
MRSSTLRNVALAILALALAYHLGARTSQAQAPGNSVVGFMNWTHAGSVAAVVTANGDLYTTASSTLDGPWTMNGNVFGASTPVRQETLGGVKSRWAK